MRLKIDPISFRCKRYNPRLYEAYVKIIEDNTVEVKDGIPHVNGVSVISDLCRLYFEKNKPDWVYDSDFFKEERKGGDKK